MTMLKWWGVKYLSPWIKIFEIFRLKKHKLLVNRRQMSNRTATFQTIISEDEKQAHSILSSLFSFNLQFRPQQQHLNRGLCVNLILTLIKFFSFPAIAFIWIFGIRSWLVFGLRREVFVQIFDNAPSSVTVGVGE